MTDAPTLLVLADSGEARKAGPLALAVILVLCIACYFLFRSMSRHLRRVREEFPASDPSDPSRTASPASPDPPAEGPAPVDPPSPVDPRSPAEPPAAFPADRSDGPPVNAGS